MGREPPNLIPRQFVKPFLRFEATKGLELEPFGLQVPCREDALPGAGLQTQRSQAKCVGLNCLGMQIPDPNLYHENANGSKPDHPIQLPMTDAPTHGFTRELTDLNNSSDSSYSGQSTLSTFTKSRFRVAAIFWNSAGNSEW